MPVCVVQHLLELGPYGTSATSNIHIAVASEDEGRDILGVKLNIGDMVIDALHSNDQMGWQFLDTREEALAGVESGEYYAALIMPTDLTSDFVSILEGDLRHPQIQYYENEKKNAIAPQDHQQGQDRRAGGDQQHRH